MCSQWEKALRNSGWWLTLSLRTVGYPAVHISLVYEARDNPRNCGSLNIYLYGPRDIPRRTQRVNRHKTNFQWQFHHMISTVFQTSKKPVSFSCIQYSWNCSSWLFINKKIRKIKNVKNGRTSTIPNTRQSKSLKFTHKNFIKTFLHRRSQLH